MKLSHEMTPRKLSLVGKLALPALILTGISGGLIAGNILRSNNNETQAASTNITVQNNNQIISQDQSTSTQTIIKTSTVTVKNSEASHGYTLTAKLDQTHYQTAQYP